MQLKETQKALEVFIKGTIKDAKKNLAKKNASGKLANSLKGSVKVAKNSVDIEISMESYGEFQDKGVSGTKRKFNTPYSYKSKMPPPNVFDKWLIKRGIAPRNEKGQFQPRKGLAFAMPKSIQKKGIKPSLFLTKAYQKNYAKLNKDITTKYGMDVDTTLEFLLKDLLK